MSCVRVVLLHVGGGISRTQSWKRDEFQLFSYSCHSRSEVAVRSLSVQQVDFSRMGGDVSRGPAPTCFPCSHVLSLLPRAFFAPTCFPCSHVLSLLRCVFIVGTVQEVKWTGSNLALLNDVSHSPRLSPPPGDPRIMHLRCGETRERVRRGITLHSL